MVARAGSVFSETGELTDDAIRKRLAGFVAGFADHCRKARGRIPD
jgi:hypothetical protein